MPIAITFADQATQLADAPREARIKMVPKEEMPLEDLAHSFFFNVASPDNLRRIISEQGVAAIEPEIAEQSRDLEDLKKNAPKARQMCRDLQSASSGQQFASVFIVAEETDLNEKRESARRILSKLDAEDRKSLEHFLNTQYRQSANRGSLDYEGMFAFSSYPSTATNAIMATVCDSATKMEAGIEP